ncbi:unnamed protein product [Knipowitschia caucasica]
MPCRKENYIFLEQSVTVDSKEVDALVTKIGEALQLHNGTGPHHHKAMPMGGAKQTGLMVPGATTNTNTSTTAGIQRGRGCCLRIRSRGHQTCRASPYHIPSACSDQDWDQTIRPWSKKKRIAVEESDPHRLLQELILSGNLIKEAVRRLQDCVGECAPENVSC